MLTSVSFALTRTLPTPSDDMEKQLPPSPISPNIPLPLSPPPTSQGTSDPDYAASDVDEDLFPDTSIPITRQGHSDPRLVPLPPSPRIKPSLPSRKPKGWIPTISTSTSDTTISSRIPSITSESNSRGSNGRRISARLPSGPSPLRIGARTISGVMQYAMHHATSDIDDIPSLEDDHDELGEEVLGISGQPTSSISDADPVQARPRQTDTEDASDSSSIRPHDDVAEEDFSMEEIHTSVIGLTDQDQDEVWMQCVRNQLGTLFPDFFQESTPDPNVSDGEQGWWIVQNGAYRLPEGSALREGANATESGVPNVREEIHGLKDEIERLRGVVGGLAEGLHRSGVVHTPQREVAVVKEVFENGQGIVDDANHPETLHEHGDDESSVEVPEAFIKTAHLSVDIIQTLHSMLKPAPGTETTKDNDLFSEYSLVGLKKQILLRLNPGSGEESRESRQPAEEV